MAFWPVPLMAPKPKRTPSSSGMNSQADVPISGGRISIPTRRLGIPDRLVEHGDPKAIRREIDLDKEGIVRSITALLAECGGRAPKA